jgi:hypothetical protein
VVVPGYKFELENVCCESVFGGGSSSVPVQFTVLRHHSESESHCPDEVNASQRDEADSARAVVESSVCETLRTSVKMPAHAHRIISGLSVTRRNVLSRYSFGLPE